MRFDTARGTHRRRWRVVAVGLVLGLVLAACSAADESDSSGGMPVSEGADTGAEEPAEDEAARAPSSDGAVDGGADAAVVAVGAPLGRKVVFNAYLSLEADDTAATVDQIRREVERAGGFVARADLHRTERDLLAGELTLRVPAEKLGATLESLRGLAARVTDEGIDSDDVTEQYADITAQLRNLRALETELLALLADIREKSNDANQVLLVFERIREVRGQIESLQGRQQVLDDLVSLSTITVSVRPTPSAAPIASDDWRPGEVAKDAARATVHALQSLADVTIRLVITVVPLVLLIVGLPLALVLAVRRFWRRRDAQPAGPSTTV